MFYFAWGRSRTNYRRPRLPKQDIEKRNVESLCDYSILNVRMTLFCHSITSKQNENDRAVYSSKGIVYGKRCLSAKARTSVHTHFLALALFSTPRVLVAFPTIVLVLVQLLLPWS